jgi:hypothetical protein
MRVAPWHGQRCLVRGLWARVQAARVRLFAMACTAAHGAIRCSHSYAARSHSRLTRTARPCRRRWPTSAAPPGSPESCANSDSSRNSTWLRLRDITRGAPADLHRQRSHHALPSGRSEQRANASAFDLPSCRGSAIGLAQLRLKRPSPHSSRLMRFADGLPPSPSTVVAPSTGSTGRTA